MDLRPTLSRLRKLLATRDPADCEQLVEIAISLDDPRLFEALLRGVDFEARTQNNIPVGALRSGELFTADSKQAQRHYDHALRLLLSRIPERHERARELREKITSLTLHLAEPYPQMPLDLGPLLAFKRLRRIDLRGVSEVKNLGVLGELPALEEIYFHSGILPEGFENLHRSKSLKRLFLQGAVPRLGDLGEGPELRAIEMPWASQLQSLTGMESLKAIERIDLRGCHTVGSLAAFAKISTLKSLTLESFGNTELKTLEGIEKNKGLESIAVSAPIHSIEALRGMTELTRVSLSRCTNLTGVGALSGATKLSWVNLSHTAISSLDGLEDSDMDSVELTYCHSLADLRGLRGTRKIKAIDWLRMNALRSLDGLENLKSLEHLHIDNPHSLESISALGGIDTLVSVQFINAWALSSLDGLQSARSLASLTVTDARVLSDVTALAGHDALKHLVLTRCPDLRDVTALASLKGLEILDLSHALNLSAVNALAALPGLKALGLGHTAVERATLDPKLKRVATFAAEPDLHALALRGPIERHGSKVPEAVTKDLKKSYQRLKRLLLARDISLVDQGIELASALAEPGIFDGLLDGVTYQSDLRRSRHVHAARCSRGGMFVGNQALEVTGPGLCYRDRALLGLLARAPESCATAVALRAEVSSLEIDGESVVNTHIPVDLAPLTAFEKLTTLCFTHCESLENFDRVAELKGLVALSCIYCAPEDFSALRELPKLARVYVLQHWKRPREALGGFEGFTALTELNLNGGVHSGGFTLQEMPSLTSLKLAQVQHLDALALRACPRLREVEVSNCHALETLDLEGCSELVDLSLISCAKLRALRGLGRMALLEKLSVHHAAAVVLGSADLEGLLGLKELSISGCAALTDLKLLSALGSLERLNLLNCVNLEDISTLSALPKLKELRLSGCSKVSDLTTVSALGALSVLELRYTKIDKTKLPTKLKRIAR